MEEPRDNEIQALRAGVEELRRERQRLLGIVSTTHLEPSALTAMEGRLLAIRQKLSCDLDRLVD